MSIFRLAYPLLSCIFLLPLFLASIFNWQAAMVLAATPWIFLNLCALGQCQRNDWSMKAPLCCLLMSAIALHFFAMSAMSADWLAPIFSQLACVTLCVLSPVHFGFLLRLLFQRASTEQSEKQLKASTELASFTQRAVAGIIDGFFIGLMNAVLLFTIALIGQLVARFTDPSASFHISPLGAATAGFGLGIISPFTGFSYFLLSLALFSQALEHKDNTQIEACANGIGLILANALSIAYFTVMESSRYRGTLGKLYMRYEVTTLSEAKMSPLQAFFRCASKAVSLSILALGYFYAPFSPQKQAVHDLLAGSITVNATPSDNPEILEIVYLFGFPRAQRTSRKDKTIR